MRWKNILLVTSGCIKDGDIVHLHSVYDVDKHFNIDGVTRQIINESSAKSALIQYDHNSERFTFDLPKEIEGHNMMDCNVVEVHYLNFDSLTGEETKGVYTVDDMQLSPNDENVVIFSWLISANATQLVGQLNFLVRFACVAEDGTVDYAWHTDVYRKITVSRGINNTNYVATKYADVLEQWKNEILDIVNGGTGGAGGNGSGADGYSPTVDITDVENGHRVTVTDVNGTKSFDVMDGLKGDKGDTGERGLKGDKGDTGVAGIVVSDTEPLPDADGNHPVWVNPNGENVSHLPEKGVDYWTEEDKAEIVQDVLSHIVNGNEVSY